MDNVSGQARFRPSPKDRNQKLRIYSKLPWASHFSQNSSHFSSWRCRHHVLSAVQQYELSITLSHSKDQNLQLWCGNQKPRTDVTHCFLSSYVHDSVYSYQYKQQNELQWSWSLVQECHNSFRWHSILFLHNMQQMVLRGGSNGQYIMLWLENSFKECFNSTWAWEFGSVRIRKHISPIGFVRFRGNDWQLR